MHEILIKAPQETEFSDVESVRKPHGFLFVNGQEVANTLRCCHCQTTWVPKRGSKRIRGWCSMCGDVTCGSLGCIECVPFEKQLDKIENEAKLTRALKG